MSQERSRKKMRIESQPNSLSLDDDELWRELWEEEEDDDDSLRRVYDLGNVFWRRVVYGEPHLIPRSYPHPLEQIDGIVMKVLSHLQVSEVVRSQRVSKRWKLLCNRIIENSFQPTKEFDNHHELRYIVRQYCRSKQRWSSREAHVIDGIGERYGYPINKWRVGKVSDFTLMFGRQPDFNEDIGDWDVSSATSMDCMFEGVTSFNQPLAKWNTSKVEDMTGMFCGAESFNQPLDSWDTSNVRNMKKMFHGATQFNQPLNVWNTGRVQDMVGMFYNALAFNQHVHEWDTSSVTKKEGMLYNTKYFRLRALPGDIVTWNDKHVTLSCFDERFEMLREALGLPPLHPT